MPKGTKPFPQLALKGKGHDLGLQQGKALAGRIKKTLKFYLDFFNRPQKEVLVFGKNVFKIIKNFFPELGEEIKGIAKGSALDYRFIAALNARTELMAQQFGECTALYLRESVLLGQNWDWVKAMEKWVVILKIEKPDGHQMLFLTEPGIIGKIGLNSAGVGVCLNFLPSKTPLLGVPIHIILRTALESKSISQFKKTVGALKIGTSSNIIIADHKGNCLCMEFSGAKIYSKTVKNNDFCHTNHLQFTRPEKNGGYQNDYYFKSSKARLSTMEYLIRIPEGRQGLRTFKKLIQDKSHLEFPICAPYMHDRTVNNPIGTVTSIIMDLKNRELHFTPGSPYQNKFRKLSLNIV